MKEFKRHQIPKHCHPLVRKLVERMNHEQIGLSDMAERSGVSPGTQKSWRHRATPIVSNLEACLNVLGYELTIRKIKDDA